jgi:AraC family transcriptional regulator
VKLQHAEGRGLAVFYADGCERLRMETAPDEIRIVVPGDRTPIFRTDVDAAGRVQREQALRFPHVCIVPPSHRMGLAASEPAELTWLALDRGFCEAEARRELGYWPRHLERCIAEDPFVRACANVMRVRFRVGGVPSGELIERSASGLALHLARCYGGPQRVRRQGGLASHRLERVLAFIDSQLADALPVSALAARAAMSPFHFARRFKASLGVAPHAYVTARRMERAKSLLAGSELALAEVARSVGYHTQAHFTEVFHQQVGTTPGRYREAHRASP